MLGSALRATTPRSWLSAEMLTTQLSHASTLKFLLSGTSNVALIKASDEPRLSETELFALGPVSHSGVEREGKETCRLVVRGWKAC